MYASFSVCATEAYQRKYMDFLLANYEDLRLPYPFPVAFGFIASPFLMGRECFLCLDDEGEAIGAFGYIHGTGEGNYEDRHVVQLQIAFLSKPYRHTRLFLRGLQILAKNLNELNEVVTELVFWTGIDDYAIKLFDKFAERTRVGELAVGYRLTLRHLNAYLARFKRDSASILPKSSICSSFKEEIAVGRLFPVTCNQDREYARFVRYFLAHSDEFDERFLFFDAVAHMTVSLRESRQLLFDDGNGKLQGYIQYRMEAEGETVFIESAILSPAYRSGIQFYKGLAEWTNRVMEEHIEIHRVRFHVRADHAYLIRLYSKFARKIGETESRGRAELVFETAFDELRSYLRADDTK